MKLAPSRLRPLSLALALGAFAGFAHAHTAWLEPVTGAQGAWRVLFGGHEGKTEAYPPEKLKSVEAFSTDGTALQIERTDRADGVRIQPQGDAVVLLLHFDNGIYSRPEGGRSVNKPMSEVPGAISGVRALKYHKTIAGWGTSATRAWGQPFEVVPLEADLPRAGSPMRVRVLVDGKPVAGVKIAIDETAEGSLTDAEGIASFIPQEGFNRLWAGRRAPVQGNPDYTTLSIEYVLGFEAGPAR